MHLGKLVPRCLRPDFTLGLLWLDVLPRRFVLKCQHGSGSLVTPWDNVEALSDVYQVADDGQSIFYNVATDDVPGKRWELRFGLRLFPAGPTATQQDVTLTYTYFVDDVETAHQPWFANPGQAEWWKPYEFYTLQNGLEGSWVHSVPNSQFRSTEILIGSASWARQPEYHPYRHDP